MDDSREDPIFGVMRLIGGKYKVGIIWLLSSHDHMGFNELKRALVSTSSPRMLSISLGELESDGLIFKRVVSESPRRVQYSLTGTGRSLIPLLEDLCAWGAAYQDRFRS